MSNRNLGFLYTGDWSHEFDAFDRGEVPAHRLFGAGQTKLHGLGARHCNWGRLPLFARHRHLWKIWQSLWCLITQRTVRAFVATSESTALGPLFLRRVGVLRRPVIVISVALLRPSYQRGLKFRLVRWLLGRADCVVVYASAQIEATSACFSLPAGKVRFLPFGVDTDFFSPAARVDAAELSVVSVGTNEGKDYPTLLAALAPDQDCTIVTDQINARVIAGTLSKGKVLVQQNVPIRDLRTLYASAGRRVIPLKESLFSSGQTVLLEMMAMGLDVVVADVSAVRDYVTPLTATTYPPGDVDELRAHLERRPAPRPAAAERVQRLFSSSRFSSDLCRLVEELSQESLPE